MTPSALRLQTPCRSSSSRARRISLSSLPSALANSAGVAESVPRLRSACKQSQTNSLKVASESSLRAQVTSRPAANQPVGCFSCKPVPSLIGHPLLPACGRASCAWTRPLVSFGRRFAAAGRGCYRQWWDRRFARANEPPASARSKPWSGADNGRHRPRESRGDRCPSGVPWQSRRATAHRSAPSAVAFVQCCRRHGLRPVRGITRWFFCAALRSRPGMLSVPRHRRASSYRSRWGRSHSTYISEYATIHYPWCDLFGSKLPVLRRMRRQEVDWLICEMPQGHAAGFPAWMTQQAACASFSIGPPLASVSALAALRAFLDALHPAGECNMPSRNTSLLESLDETKQKEGSAAGQDDLRTRAQQRSRSSRVNHPSTGRTGKDTCRTAVENSSGQQREHDRSRR